MKTPALVLGAALLVLLSTGCDFQLVPPREAFDARSAGELAPHLNEIETTFPESHRILSDGTWDSFDLEEKLEFVRRLSIDHAEREHRRRAEKLAKDRRNRSERGLDDAFINESEVFRLLHEIRMIEIELAGARQVDQIDAVGDLLTGDR
ncbi:MAG: hypothetical protein F4089_11820 [Gammaproteobacteria bacterium]|nr:hypothetical protein [Gammaproteobacteria bacterium]